jgi:hypothetical protein
VPFYVIETSDRRTGIGVPRIEIGEKLGGLDKQTGAERSAKAGTLVRYHERPTIDYGARDKRERCWNQSHGSERFVLSLARPVSPERQELDTWLLGKLLIQRLRYRNEWKEEDKT